MKIEKLACMLTLSADRIIFLFTSSNKRNCRNTVLIQLVYIHKVISPDVCVMCGANLESVPHLFLHCSVADHLQNTLFDIFGECWVCPATLDQLLLYWFWQEEEAKYLWQCATYATVWGIWLERNFRTFNDRFSHKQVL